MLTELIQSARQQQEQHWDKIKQLEDKKRSLAERIQKEYTKNFSDCKLIYKPLAQAICQKMRLKYYEIYGPFGLDRTVAIFFSNESRNPSKSSKLGLSRAIDICEVDTYNLYDLVAQEDYIEYVSGKEPNQTKQHLPEDLDDIIKLLQFSPKHRGGEK